MTQTRALRPPSMQRAIRLHNAGCSSEAEEECRAILDLDPGNVDALHMLAMVLGTRGEFAASERLLSRALVERPSDPELHNDLAVTLERAGDLARAAERYRQAIRLRPRFHQAWSNFANTLLHGGDAPAALDACQRAVELMPTYAPAHNTLGAALSELGRVEDAIAAYRRATLLRPDHAEAHANLGMALLLVGEFEHGWPEYEWRRKLSNPVFRRQGNAWEPATNSGPGEQDRIAQARSTSCGQAGCDPFGQTFLLYGEGGLGNVIQFARYIPLMAERGVRAILECDRELAALLGKIRGVWKVIAPGETPPRYDAHCPLASLPSLLNTRLSTIPARVPYLDVDTQLSERWGEAVRNFPGLRVGVCWMGDQRLAHRRGRSFDPRYLRPLGRIPGVSLFNLQYGAPEPRELPLVKLAGLEPKSMRLAEQAAIMKHLDLVITCDTSTAHLAGAMGINVWVALQHVADWRWMLEREDCPWYPTMRLFRQSRQGDWQGVFDRMADRLRQRIV